MQGMQPAPNKEDLWEVKQCPLDNILARLVNVRNKNVKRLSELRCESDESQKEEDERHFSIVR